MRKSGIAFGVTLFMEIYLIVPGQYERIAEEGRKEISAKRR